MKTKEMINDNQSHHYEFCTKDYLWKKTGEFSNDNSQLIQASNYESFDQGHSQDSDGGDDAAFEGDATQGSFEVLDSSKMSHSGSFNASETITFNKSDTRMENLQPKICVNNKRNDGVEDNDENAVHLSEEQQDGEGTESSREKVDLTLAAGKRCFLPVIVPDKALELTWEFTSAPKVSQNMKKLHLSLTEFLYIFLLFVYLAMYPLRRIIIQ